jgi:predicted transposase/invertase (TIGR01784 family)
VYQFEVRERRPGIYYVEGDIFAIQIIERRRLEGRGGIQLLKDLRGGLNGEQLQRIIEMVRKMPEGMPLSAYIHMLLQANSKGLREMRAMSDTSLEAVLEELGFTAEWEARGLQKGLEKGLQKGREEGREEAVRRLQKYGMDPKQISEALELPLGTVFRYLKAE